MGSVYLARDLDLDRDVAIKFISPDRAADANARRRLIREARAAAALDHPNICAVHDVIVEPDGHAFIVMQYVEGETLSARLQRGPLDPRQTFHIAADVAAALSAAHKRGIIHRDVKPQNIIITPSGKAKLLDFGIARLDDAGAASQGDSTVTSLTGPGRAAGTPTYMSPEQVQQQPLDGRSDLFSLGAVVFQCLTGRRPFDGASDAEVYVKILQEHPPAASSLRDELTEREDELCRRLLAKHPDDRFGSADELLGALRVLAPDTSHPSGTREIARPRPWRRFMDRRALAVAALAIAAVLGAWLWLRPKPLPDPPPEAERWYLRGTEAIRDGAYHGGRLALQEAIRLFPSYAVAYASLAEAHTELDESDGAQNALLMVDKLIPNVSRLDTDDRLRLDAVRSLVLRDAGAAVRSYTELAARRPQDARVWLDLGRAQEAAASPGDARTSYERAIAADRQYAAAHLRRAVVLTQQGNRDEAIREFDEAERLYRAAANVEGESETLLRRGTFLSGLGRLAEARSVLERAAILAGTLESRSHQMTLQLRLSSVAAREGRISEAEALAATAVKDALENGLETVAADGLIELGTRLMRDRPADADAQLQRAIELAERRGAQRLLARARLQRASLMLRLNRPADALALTESSVEFMRSRGYRRSELMGLTIQSRAHELLQQHDKARPLAERVLQVAEELKDDTQVAEALENLASQSAAVGNLPDALGLRERRERMHREQRNAARLAFDLTSRAELLMRLGRFEEAAAALQELTSGMAGGVEAYKARARRVELLRALQATIELRFDAAARSAAAVLASPEPAPDPTGDYAAALLAHAWAKRGRREPSKAPSGSQAAELRYWHLSALLAARDDAGVLEGVTATLRGPIPSYELEWRLTALGAAAARRIKAYDEARQLADRAQRALARLRSAWKAHAVVYEGRPDLIELRRTSGLDSTPRGRSRS